MFRARPATIGLVLTSLVISDDGFLVSQSVVAHQRSGAESISQRAGTTYPLDLSSSADLAVSSPAGQLSASITRTQALLQSVRATSFSELSQTDIQVREFHSQSDYFRTRFSSARYAGLRKMRFFLEVNPQLFERAAPEEGLRAIIAHELEHVLSLSRRSRLGLLSLTPLTSESYTTRFERRADLGTIARGYDFGLSLYRQWLYRNIAKAALARKRRDYFSPAEITLIQATIEKRPEMPAYWLKHVPISIDDIRKQASASAR